MAKKTNWKDILGGIGDIAGGITGGLKRAARDTMQEAQVKIQEITRIVIKSAVVFIIMVLGFIYVLNGFAKYLDAANNYLPGTGAMIIGGVLIILGIFAWIMRR